MNKLQTVWLIVRLIGVYFGYWAIVTFLSLVGAIYAFVSIPSANTPNKANTNTNVNRPQVITPMNINPAGVETPKSETEKVADKAKSEALKEVFWQLFLTLIYGGIAFYLIRNGKHLFVILNREEFFEKREEIRSDSPKKEDYNAPVYDEPMNVSSRKEEVTSLNLTEYVPLSQRIKEAETEQTASNETADETAEIEKSVSEISETETEKPILEEEIAPPEISSSEIETLVASLDKEVTAPMENEPSIPAEHSSAMENEILEIEETPVNNEVTPTDLPVDDSSQKQN